jgi:ribose transport system ATP-binding protein
MSSVVSIEREGTVAFKNDHPTRHPVLRAEGVSKRYGPVTVLSEVTLDILPGEIHAIIGENGAGKSTFMRILSGYAEPTAGILSMDGRQVRLPSPNRLRTPVLSWSIKKFCSQMRLPSQTTCFLAAS